MYENITIEEYINLTPAERKKVKKDKVHELLDEQVARRNLPHDGDLKTLISDAVREAMKDDVIALQTDVAELKDELKLIKEERDQMKKVISEQQKFLETVRRDRSKNNLFMSGIPNSFEIDGVETTDNDKIVKHILSFVHPTIAAENYKCIKTFEPRDGLPRHSCLLGFQDADAKKNVLSNSRKLNGLDESDPMRRVFIKNEQTPLTRKENTRLYNEFKKLEETHKDNGDMNVKLERGKLFLNDQQVDEFSLVNQLF